MKEIRFNVLALALIGALVLCGFALALGDKSDVGAKEVLIALGGTLIGAIAATMTKLVEPPDPPSDPTVPASTVEKILIVTEKAVELGLPSVELREVKQE